MKNMITQSTETNHIFHLSFPIFQFSIFNFLFPDIRVSAGRGIKISLCVHATIVNVMFSILNTADNQDTALHRDDNHFCLRPDVIKFDAIFSHAHLLF